MSRFAPFLYVAAVLHLARPLALGLGALGGLTLLRDADVLDQLLKSTARTRRSTASDAWFVVRVIGSLLLMLAMFAAMFAGLPFIVVIMCAVIVWLLLPPDEAW